MSINDLRQVWGQPGIYAVSDGMFQSPGGSRLYDTTGFTESPSGSGLYAFNEIPATSASLTPHLEANPWVEVYFPQLNPATDAVTIYRYSEGRTWRVRGGVEIAPGVPAQDFEAPFNIESTYRAEMFDAAGLSLGFTDPVSITLTVPEGTTVVHQPLEPSLWTTVTIENGSGESIVRPTPENKYVAEGAVLPRRIGQRRRGVAGLALKLFTTEPEQADAVQAMLGDYEVEQVAILCMRTTDPIRIPATFFFGTESLEEVGRDVQMGGTAVTFQGTVDEVEPPYPGLVVPLLSYDDIDASFATYDDADAAFATYTDRDRAYDLAGAAG
ncbi:hypothetical protein P5G50_18300 [Leifsonia sp. F6_8S_P_1B]|uniref:Uncharacterized protein n=1 Tax=Leifsonia williamsii TaxID=3035919 RepID=A0ABT8KG14_9MICO|nr:hypothetical protein [Leifsonia williamsii]MDN4616403.1 hypothetical protein [Leifsonia williamsii]